MQETDSASPVRGMRAPVFAIAIVAAALVAGVLSGRAVLKLGSYFGYPPELAAVVYAVNADVDSAEVQYWDRKLLSQNTTLSSLVTGLLVAGLLGLVGGLRHSLSAAFIGLGIGSLLGLVCGAIGGFSGAFVWQYLVDNDYLRDNTNDTTMHAAIANSLVWGFIGLASGAAACWRNNRANGMIAGVVGGVLGAWLFMLAASFAFTSVKTGLPIPANIDGTPWVMARMLWAIIPAAVIGLLIARSSTSSSHQSSEEHSNEVHDS